MAFHDGLEHVVREGEPLAPYTWLRLGGEARYFAEPTNRDELAELVRRSREEGLPVKLLGAGSNVLVRDEGVPGLVLHLSAPPFTDIAIRDRFVTASGGTKLAHLISAAVREGLAGLEQLVGIPGTVGGALRGNASCHGRDIGQSTVAATVLSHTGEIIARSRDELVFAYRESSLDELVILDAQFELEPTDARELTKRMQKQWIVNKAAQPLHNQPTAMIFKDAGGISAASLIEQAGMKAARVGAVGLSDRNANFLVAEPGASSREVLELIDLVRNRVSQRLGVELEIALDIW